MVAYPQWMVIRGGGPVHNEVCCSYRGITNSLPRKLYAGVLETRFHLLVNLGYRTFGTHTTLVRAWPVLPPTNQTISIHDRGNRQKTGRWFGAVLDVVPVCFGYQTSYNHTFTYGHNLWVVTKRMRSLIQAMEISFLRHGMRFCDI